jgi:branched-chain amino acid transport system permease protein
MFASILDLPFNDILRATLSAFFGVNAMYFAIAAIGLNVQFGYAGLLNFGQAGFMACGAYAVGMTTHYYHISFWWGIPIAIAYAVIFGLIMGVPTLRLRADYLAIVTIALAEVIRLLVRSVTFKKKFGGSDGINGFAETFRNVTPFDDAKRYKLYPFDASNGTGAMVLLLVVFALLSVMAGRMIIERFGREGMDKRGPWALASVAMFGLLLVISTYVEYAGLSFKAIVVGWILAAVLGLFVYMLMRSPWGRVLKGIREDEEAVRSLGKSVYSYKMQALILGGVIATFSGMMFSLDRGSVQPDNYSRDVTFYVLTALVLGGAAKVSGSIVGPMLFWGILSFADVFLNSLFKLWGNQIGIFGWKFVSNSSQVGMIVQGLIGLMLVLLMVFRPQGLFGNRKEMALDGR